MKRWLGLFLFAAACRDTRLPVDRPVLTADEAPAAAVGAMTPHLVASADGTIWMSWLEATPDSSWQLQVAHRVPRGQWSAPRTIVRDSLLFANWADFPALAVDSKDRLVAHFLRRAGPGKFNYAAWVTTSADSGATWSAPQRLHGDTSATEHGFVAMVPQPEGGVFAAWLDGRATGGGSHGAAGHEGMPMGAMQLGFGRVDSTLRVQPDTILDVRTCDCCQVAGARTSAGVIFAYRDRSPDEVRDIAVVRYEDGKWFPPAIVHADGWVTKACPVNGPQLSARDRGVAIAWFTNARDTAKVQLAFSKDRGATWGAPIRIDDGSPLGRVDVEYLLDGGALVTWMERTGTNVAEIRAKRVAANGAVSDHLTVAVTSDARPAGFPRITAAKDKGVYISWREMTSPARLRLALIEVPGG